MIISITQTQPGKQATQYRFVESNTITIGRSSSNDISIHKDSAASREHCQIVNEGGQWYLVDEGSKNGTFLESESAPGTLFRVQGRILLADGQRFRAGRTWFVLDKVTDPART